MDEELRTYVALCDDADTDVDYHLAQLALRDNSGNSPDATHSCDVAFLSNHDIIEDGTERALSHSTVEDRVFDGNMLCTNMVIPKSNQAVRLSPLL